MNEEFDLEKRTRRKIEENVNSIRQQWNTPAFDGKMLLLVENIDDRKCYYKLFNSAKVEIRTAKGCNSMRKLYLAIQSTGIPNFAIQDGDFARVCERVPTEDNYFLTDRHDHEMMCLEKEDILKALFLNQAIDYDPVLIDDIFDDLKLISHYKWYNFKYRLKVKFKGYNPRDKSKVELHSFDAINATVMRMSPNCTSTITKTDVDAFVCSQPAQDRFEITNGHDFLDLLAQGIGEKIGSPSLKTDDLRIVMYANFTPERFRQTQLYNSIRIWAGAAADTLFAA